MYRIPYENASRMGVRNLIIPIINQSFKWTYTWRGYNIAIIPLLLLQSCSVLLGGLCALRYIATLNNKIAFQNHSLEDYATGCLNGIYTNPPATYSKGLKVPLAVTGHIWYAEIQECDVIHTHDRADGFIMYYWSLFIILSGGLWLRYA